MNVGIGTEAALFPEKDAVWDGAKSNDSKKHGLQYFFFFMQDTASLQT